MMKFAVVLLCFLSATLAMAPPGQAPAPPSSSLAAFMPTGSLLFVESPDFAKLVHDWNNSQEKQKWLESDNFQVFSRSRLFLRLQEAQRQFAVAAGAPPDMALLDSLAGGQSALAIYDIGNLEFLYITRMPSARAMQNVLWTSREKFEPRKAADLPYYVRTEPEKNRLVAFATSGDYLLLATREDLMAGALGLLSGKSQPRLPDETWYKSAVAAAGPIGDVRLVMNLPLLVKSPHFRSYWIERNVAELKPYSAEVADVHRSATEVREDRVLLKTNPPGRDGASHCRPQCLGRIDWHGPGAARPLPRLERPHLRYGAQLGAAEGSDAPRGPGRSFPNRAGRRFDSGAGGQRERPRDADRRCSSSGNGRSPWRRSLSRSS